MSKIQEFKKKYGNIGWRVMLENQIDFDLPQDKQDMIVECFDELEAALKEIPLPPPLSTGASPVKPDGSAGLSESRVTQTDPEKQLGLHDGINQKPK